MQTHKISPEKNISSNFDNIYLKIFQENDEICVYFQTSINKRLKFNIDTGAAVSILRAEKILDAKINSKNRINLIGLTQPQIKTMGTSKIEFDFEKTRIQYMFHVIFGNHHLQSDGLLGSDFLITYNAKIDFHKRVLCLKFDSNKIQMKNVAELNKNKQISSVKKGKEAKENFYEKLDSDTFKNEKYTVVQLNRLVGNEEPSLNDYLSKVKKIFMIKNKCSKNSSNRVDILKTKIKYDNLTTKQIKITEEFCKRFSDAFYIEGDILKPTNAYEHYVKLKPNVDVVHTKQYRIPQAQKIEIERQVLDLQKKNIIEKSTSRFNSPLLLVKKSVKEGEKQEYRLVIDYRNLNKACISQYYAMPLIDEIVDQLGNSKLFTILDVQSAFHQVPLHPDCRQLTAFSTSFNHFQFKTVPFGMQSSPVAWLYTISKVLQEFINKNLFVYVDDIIIHTSDEKSHIELIEKVLKKLISHNIKLKPEKCKFFQKQVKYLGYEISEHGLAIDKTKMRCIHDYPRPTNVVETQRFLGFINFYRKYICNLAKIARPLYQLCKKDGNFQWDSNCQDSFEHLKNALITPPVLAFPRFDLEFILVTDASLYAVGGILSNLDGKEERPIQYFSRSLNETQTRYSTIERELLAIIWSVEWYRAYLYARRFYIVTDHKPLQYLFNNNHTNARIHRWRITLMEYDFEIMHREGRANRCSDALSRIKIENKEEEEEGKFKTIFLVQTRSKTSNETYEPGKKSKADFYYIEEKNNLLIESNDYDHIFYCFNKINCTMHKQLQYKLKKQIVMEELKFGELFALDEKRSIILIPDNLLTNINGENARKSIKLLTNFCNNKHLENIAVNIDIRESRSFFELKKTLREYFHVTNIKITLFLNKVIELTTIDEINKVMRNFHDTLLGGHASYERMLNSIRRYYKWHNMNQDIREYTKNCEICQKSKITRHTRQPMVISSIPLSCFATIFIDHVGPILPPTPRSHSYILTIMDDLSKYAIAIAVPNTSADITARHLVEDVFLKYGWPSKIVSDNFSSFTGETMKQITKLLKINQVFCSPYHPASNAVERFHKTLGNMLKTFTSDHPDKWDVLLPYVTFSYNITIHTSTDFSPNELLFGRQIELPTSITKGNSPSYTYENYADELRQNLKISWQIAKENLLKKKENNKELYDQRKKTKNIELNIGDMVYVLKHKKNHKFDTPYEGPYPVVKLTGENTIMIKKNNKLVRVHKDFVKKYIK